MEIDLDNIGVTDLSSFQRAFDPSIIGIIGSILMRKMPCQLNLDAQTLELYANEKKPPVPSNAVSFSYQEENNTYYLPFELGGKTHLFLFDTGSTSSQITSEIAQSVDAIPLPFASVSLTAGGVKESKGVVLSEWKWRDTKLKQVLLSVSEDRPALGMDILQRFNIIFDTQNKKIHLVPRKSQTKLVLSPALPSVSVRKEDGKYVIDQVLPASDAFEKGLRVGDVLLSVDETPTEHLSTEQVQRLVYGQVGVEAKIVVQRNTEVKTLSYKRYPLTLFAAPSRFGLQVELSKKGDLEVFLAKKGSVAEQLGVKAGDQVVGVNDVTSPIERVLEQFEGEQKTLKMTLKRKETGKTDTVILSLASS